MVCTPEFIAEGNVGELGHLDQLQLFTLSFAVANKGLGYIKYQFRKCK